MRQLLQVERQRGWRNAGELADAAGGETGRAGLDQGTEDGQAGILGQGCQSSNSVFCFHVSIVVEIWKQKQALSTHVFRLPVEKSRGQFVRLRTQTQ
ncbi:MAG: hypothetical protein ABS93_02435 [Thiobacillus sp. SCN 62-729]|nr:MAG: hypothetical protein ABS93_02435 [Thiobacillus sp. SCN 62-729]